jgi:hypothetical protein
MPILAPIINAIYTTDGSYTIPETGTVQFFVAGGSGAGGQNYDILDQYGSVIGTNTGGTGRSGFYITFTTTLAAGSVLSWFVGGGGALIGAGGTNSLGWNGGAGGTGTNRGSGGGASTVVRLNGSNYIIAGGGGGGGGASDQGNELAPGTAGTRVNAVGGNGTAGGANGGGGGGGGGNGTNSGNGGAARQGGASGANLVPSGATLTQVINAVAINTAGARGFVRIVYTPAANGKSPLPSTGALSLSDIQSQFGGANPIGINEYYRNGGIVLATDAGTMPSSGVIAIGDFRNGKRTQLNQEVFTSSQAWTSPPAVGPTMQVWVIAGGGGGGGLSGGGVNGGGGGGGGGIAYHGSFPLAASTAYTISVGAGGAVRTVGTDSSLSGAGNSITAYGGGRGANATAVGGNGGSGGGAAGNAGLGNFRVQRVGGAVVAAAGATNFYGNIGGSSYFFDGGGGTNFTPSGGGGGGGAVGGTWGNPSGGAGLIIPELNGYAGVNGQFAGGGGGGAYRSSLTNTPVGGYPGGAGGGARASTYTVVAGTPNTGGGGGGVAGGQNFGSPGPSTGGSGVIIIRFWT